MKKIIKYVLLSLILLITFSGCSNKVNDGTVTELKFKDVASLSDLKKLDGKRVKIKGYMAQSSPLDGSMAYLMNMPYQSCVFCVPNTNQLVNTLAIYPSKGKKLDFSDLALDVEGTLVFGNMTDDMGYSYNYRLVDATAKVMDSSELTDEVRIYTSLVDKGFVYSFYEITTKLEEILNYSKSGYDINSLQKIDTSKVDSLKNMFKDLKPEEYTDVIQIVNTLSDIVNNANTGLDTKQTDNFPNEFTRLQNIYNDLYGWLMKPEF